jgi:regulator of protease activity HflC (stomatin/prohibitin superfamily)
MHQRSTGQPPTFPPASSVPFQLQPRTILIGAVVLLLALTAWLGAFNTQAGTVDIVLRWGAPVRVTEPGLNFKIPFVETRHTVDLRERAYTQIYESASKDPMELNVAVTLNWAVNKQHVVQMFTQFGDLETFEQRIIAPRLPDAVKAVVSRFAVNELLTKRNELRDQAKAAVYEVIPQQIIAITGFAVKNVEFPKAYTQQIAAVQVAREAANAQEQELRKQNFKAQETVNTAKAQADATKARAEAEAYAIMIKGKAQLDIQERQAAILKSNPLLIDWERATRLVPGVLPNTFIGGDASAALMFKLGASQPGSSDKGTDKK